MSIEKFAKLETFKGISKKSSDIQQIFLNLKFNKKKPKYNYHSGLVAGMLVRDLTIIKPIIEAKNPVDNEVGTKILEHLLATSKGLVEDFNWNLEDLTNLAYQFFGDDS